jgi:hypothetical protein
MYSTPYTTISSIGAANTPIPVLIESDTTPTERPAGTPLQVGDVWYNQLEEIESIYVLKNNLGLTGWQAVGGENYIKEISATITPNILDLPIATTETLGVVRVGTGLSVNGSGTLTVDPNETFQTIQVNGTATLHTIITGSSTDGVAINASAGEVTAAWINTGKNPTQVTTDPNYNVSLRTTGDIVTHEVKATDVTLTGGISGPASYINTFHGNRLGVLWKLSAGDGLNFNGQASGHIGGTVGDTGGNAYNVGYGTLELDNTVVRTTGAQVITGDLNLAKGVGPNTTNKGTLTTTQVTFSENFDSTGDAGLPTLGKVTLINSGLYFANGSGWVPLSGGSGTSYTLPIATANLLGGIRIGSGLTIDANTGICDADAAVLLNGGGQITSGNVILDSGYVRVDNDLGTDAAFEARLGSTLKMKVMANGGIAIGGTIDESTNQNGAQVSIRSTGSCTFKGKVDVNKLAFLSNFDSASSAGTPTLGLIAMINSLPYFGNGTQWMPIQLGTGLNLE